jgi:hypothetical protein
MRRLDERVGFYCREHTFRREEDIADESRRRDGGKEVLVLEDGLVWLLLQAVTSAGMPEFSILFFALTLVPFHPRFWLDQPSNVSQSPTSTQRLYCIWQLFFSSFFFQPSI